MIYFMMKFTTRDSTRKQFYSFNVSDEGLFWFVSLVSTHSIYPGIDPPLTSTSPKGRVQTNQVLLQSSCRVAPLPDAVNIFAWSLFKKLVSLNLSKNIVINPTTVQYLLSVLNIGAESTTKRELCDVAMLIDPRQLENLLFNHSISNDSKDNNEYVTANGIFVDSKVGIHQNFKNLIQDTAQLTINAVDFSGEKQQKTIDYINSWASQNTRGTINQILDPANEYRYTKLLLGSAVYFRGTWRTAFHPSFYQDGFKASNKQRIQVPFMYQQRHFYSGPIQDDHDFNKEIGYFVELPYENNQFTMLIILPAENQPLDGLIEKINIKQILSGTSPRSGLHDVNVTLPKFEINFSQSLVPALTAMGLNTTFSPQASFPYLLKGESAAVAEMIQDAYVNVDEKGTRAAAVTTVNVIALSASEPDETVQLTVDRPFLAIITIHGTFKRIPLFICRIINPRM